MAKPIHYDNSEEPSRVETPCGLRFLRWWNDGDKKLMFHENDVWTRKKRKVTCKHCLRSKLYRGLK